MHRVISNIPIINDFIAVANRRIVVITAQKMKFSFEDFYSKCDQIPSFLRIWSNLLKKSLIENFIFCAVYNIQIRISTSSKTELIILISIGNIPKLYKNKS